MKEYLQLEGKTTTVRPIEYTATCQGSITSHYSRNRDYVRKLFNCGTTDSQGTWRDAKWKATDIPRKASHRWTERTFNDSFKQKLPSSSQIPLIPRLSFFLVAERVKRQDNKILCRFSYTGLPTYEKWHKAHTRH